ncbi:phosphoglucosamine mutase [Desulfosarcina sp. OttesenSCG-928-A07]|nr:phosphoglucosamine mutase [Desulfosarcina sp. OttesenSCG-928-G17]MDL2329291.1 phosphoglucosamine mutase [Desulfosarcina sp. OttesenSCG-928-A07]
MNKLFGTDGIRGVANQYPLDAETAIKAGRAIADFFCGQTEKGRFVIGRDTRISGDMLVFAISAGICSMGHDVRIAEIIPTPGLAYLTRSGNYDAGIMISASHNPYGDNGIKLFRSDGFKLSDDDEARIEHEILESDPLYRKSRTVSRLGTIFRMDDAADRYCGFLRECMGSGFSLEGVRLVMDCAHGAASKVAPKLFRELGAQVTAICCNPNGININENCGSQHTGTLSARVVAEKVDIGLAFDGDADRLIVVDENGKSLSGDQIMAVCAKSMMERGILNNQVVVSTVMSNMGFGTALKKMGVRHIQASVGDRHVVEEMRKTGAVLGGEDSGHLIFLNSHTTGDGMLAALNLLNAVRRSNTPLSELSTIMTVYPQCLINVDVSSKPPLDQIPDLVKVISHVESKLGENGRVLVRYSGTQSQCRVMVEGPTETETRSLCEEIAWVVKKELG